MTPISPECPLLPKDLIIEILLRSRVKTLLRFKSICKAWQSIISSSSFQYQHLGRESNRADLILCMSGYSFSLLPDGILETNPMELPVGLFEEVVTSVCGPCNGIICLCYGKYRYALWNPATRKSWLIPDHSSLADACEPAFSFWIDPLTNEFKIFWITPPFDPPEYYTEAVRRPSYFITYSSSNNTWTQIEAPISYDEFVDLYYCRYSVTNGFFYFMKYNWSTRNNTIIGYDISNELFQEIHMPEVEIYSALEFVVDLYGDSLALFISNMANMEGDPKTDGIRYTEIWVMKENGSWIKLFNGIIPDLWKVLGFWKGNEFFISRETDDLMSTELWIYDPLFGKTRKFEAEKVDGEEVVTSVPLCYKESLISVGHWI